MKDTLDSVVEELRITETELKDAVNELCLKCGDYKTEHLGTCDTCRWKEVRHRHDD